MSQNEPPDGVPGGLEPPADPPTDSPAAVPQPMWPDAAAAADDCRAARRGPRLRAASRLGAAAQPTPEGWAPRV